MLNYSQRSISLYIPYLYVRKPDIYTTTLALELVIVETKYSLGPPVPWSCTIFPMLESWGSNTCSITVKEELTSKFLICTSEYFKKSVTKVVFILQYFGLLIIYHPSIGAVGQGNAFEFTSEQCHSLIWTWKQMIFHINYLGLAIHFAIGTQSPKNHILFLIKPFCEGDVSRCVWIELDKKFNIFLVCNVYCKR